MAVKDISELSDAELESIASGGAAPDLSGISDDELEKIAGKAPAPSYDYSNIPQVASDLVKVNVDALPQYGAAIGGMFGPMGAGAGQAAGDSLKKTLYGLAETTIENEMRLPTADEVKSVLGNAVEQFNQGAVSQMTGDIAGKAVSSVAAQIPKAAKSIKGSAERLAARAIGAERGTIKKLGQEKVQETGRYALENMLKGGFQDTDELIAANLAAKARGGQKMGEVYSKIDDAGASTFNPLETAAKVDEQIGGFYRSPINKGETRQLENTLESILMRGDEAIPIKEAQKLKEELGKVANWKNNLVVSDKEKMAREAYGIVSSSIDEAVDAGAKKIGSPDLLEKLKEGKALFSSAKAAEELLTNKQAREQGNKLIGLTDWGVLGAGGAATAMTGGAGAIGTLALYGAKKYAEKFGAQQGAMAADKISKFMMNSPAIKELSKKAPKIAAQVIARTTQYALEENRGEKKWMNSGAEKLSEFVDSGKIDELRKSKKGREILIRASDLKPDSKGFRKLIEEIEAQDGN